MMGAGALDEMEQEVEEEQPVQALPHMKPRALIVVADGSEELETLILSDVLTRGGLHVVIGAIGRTRRNIVMGNFGLRIQAEKPIEECSFASYELIVLPGETGATHVRDSELVTKMLLWQKQAGRWIAASSSAPAVVLHPHDLLGVRATCAPSSERDMNRWYVDEDVVVDGRCVTSQGPGTALKLSLMLVELLNGERAAKNAAKELLVPWP
ncbi:hypothetical protein BBJ28_00007096 [Nothophytophthora sp. Chile5]|nr:hypothetical protein BBJ28_00007096 [Nothophytophthora sp. Chile5]